MSWNTCKYPDCENWARRSDGDFCSSHEDTLRKEAETSRKLNDKIAERIAKQVIKNQTPRPKPKKVSPKREELNKIYFTLVDQFKKDNPLCKANVNEYCTKDTDDPHHKRGRGIYLLEVSTWLPVCRSCHSFITAHPKEAIERGWSESRLAKQKRNYMSEMDQNNYLNPEFDHLFQHIPISFCPCHPPITGYKILVDDTGREISRERVGCEPEQHCPHCGKLWSEH